MSDIYEKAYKAADDFLDFSGKRGPARDFSDAELREGVRRAVDAVMENNPVSDDMIQWISGLAIGVLCKRLSDSGIPMPEEIHGIGDAVVKLVTNDQKTPRRHRPDGENCRRV